MKNLLLLTIAILFISCAKTENKKKSSKSKKKTTESSSISLPALNCIPSDENFSLRSYNYLTKEEIVTETNFADVDLGFCATRDIGDDFANREKLLKHVVVIGNTADLDDFNEAFRAIAFGTMYAAGSIGRIGCVFKGTEENLNIIANMEDLEILSWIGHGDNGNLSDINDHAIKIHPVDINRFKSKILRKVGLVSCQAGQKQEEWQTVFGLQAKMDLSSENIPVVEGIDYHLNGFVKDIMECNF